ncbi:MAG TPA: PEGA domain-containing protein [Rectinemataceae bacterium]|nr:PEGA domain-containing protein [Rectinemataceae bacterium]
MKRFLIIFAALFITSTALFAQRAALTVLCNTSGASVLVAGRMVGTTTPNLTVVLPVGSFPVKITKPGYQAFDIMVNLPTAGFVLTANLVPIGAGNVPQPAPAPQPASTYSLTVRTSVPNSQVIINGSSQGYGPVSVQLVPGTYNVTVRSPGMMEWSQQVQIVNGPVVLTPGFQPQNYQLQVGAANVQGAMIFLNGNQVASGSYNAALPPGEYSIVIRAPGFLDYSENFTLNGPKTISAYLQAQSFQFQASAANVPGAVIFLNGNQVGTGSYNAALPPGTYTIVIRAAGFNDYSETFQLAGPKTIAVSLQQNLVSFTFTIPPAFYNPEVGSLALGRQNDTRGKSEGKGNTVGQGRTIAVFELFVDGNLLTPSGNNTWTGAVTPGNHLFKILSGGLKVESSINLQPGKNWILQPSLGISAQ